jgi:hypothetical protein
MKSNTPTPVAARPHRQCCTRKAHPALYEVVLVVDPLAAQRLYQCPIQVHLLTISPGPRNDCLLVRAVASLRQIFKLADWVASIKADIIAPSPSSMPGLVSPTASEAAPGSINFDA